MDQPTLPKLPSCFKEPSKTLKLEANHLQFQIGEVAEEAWKYLQNQTVYNRIEAKYDQFYLVVAKLKEK